MKNVYIVLGISHASNGFSIFVPDPGVFQTEFEALCYLDEHNLPDHPLSIIKARVGKMKKKKAKKS